MRVVNISGPVMSDWFTEQGCRLDASPYLSEALFAKKILEKLPKTVPLASLTTENHGGIFTGPMSRRIYLTDPQHSAPFLGTKDMMAADLTNLPRLRKSDTTLGAMSQLQIKPGMTLISRSGFNAGRRAYVRPDMEGFLASEHAMKVDPDPKKIKPGYLFAFLLSTFGEALVRGAIYGSAVRQIDPQYIARLPIPRLGETAEERIHRLMESCARLRAQHQAVLVSATEDFFDSVGLPELNDVRWHQQERDLGFEVDSVSSLSLRALNFTPRAQQLIEKLGFVPNKSLGQICAGGSLRTGARFKRFDADPEHGVRLIGQRQAFWNRPEGRWINASQAPADIRPEDETILIAAHGTLGENEVYSRSILVTGSWLKHAFSQDFVRVLSGDPEVTGAYMFAFFRSEAAFRILRSLSVGGKQQEYHSNLLRNLPIPMSSDEDRARIAATVRYAYQCRDRADVLEDKALALLTAAIKEAVG
jgi:hypothetical protein